MLTRKHFERQSKIVAKMMKVATDNQVEIIVDVLIPELIQMNKDSNPTFNEDNFLNLLDQEVEYLNSIH